MKNTVFLITLLAGAHNLMNAGQLALSDDEKLSQESIQYALFAMQKGRQQIQKLSWSSERPYQIRRVALDTFDELTKKGVVDYQADAQIFSDVCTLFAKADLGYEFNQMKLFFRHQNPQDKFEDTYNFLMSNVIQKLHYEIKEWPSDKESRIYIQTMAIAHAVAYYIGQAQNPH